MNVNKKPSETESTPHSSTQALAIDVISPALSPFATQENASLIIGVFTDVGRDGREL